MVWNAFLFNVCVIFHQKPLGFIKLWGILWNCISNGYNSMGRPLKHMETHQTLFQWHWTFRVIGWTRLPANSIELPRGSKEFGGNSAEFYMEIHEIPWKYMETNVTPLDSMKCHDIRGIATEFHAFPWHSMGYHGVPRNSMGFHGMRWKSMRFHGHSM